MSLERDLVDDCRDVAKHMGAFLAEVGQRRAKGSGTTLGFPDLVLMCNGQTHLIEVKREKDAENAAGELNLGQQAFMLNAWEKGGVHVHAISSEREFVAIVNSCRRPSAPRFAGVSP